MKKSGILLHISSLPSPFGVGDFGPHAYEFVDFLNDCGHTYWQILPLTITDTGRGNSPYSSISAFGVNPLFISPILLKNQGLLTEEEIKQTPWFNEKQVAYNQATANKQKLLKQAFNSFSKNIPAEYEKFITTESYWLDDFALYAVLREKLDNYQWNTWPEEYKLRNQQSLQQAKQEYSEEISFIYFQQFVAHQQWYQLKTYANKQNIKIFGDVPIYVDFDSADVWSHADCFKLNEHMAPYAVSGVPPDYFSETGQLWGNPIYNWETLKEQNYSWWLNRMDKACQLYDLVRIDHFRGLAGYWEIPAGEETAIHGTWQPGPGIDFFTALEKKLGKLPIVAEDLGVITDDVKQLISEAGLPGMKILQFAFSGGEDNPYLPHHIIENCIVYTGTHDNNTTLGWFINDAQPEEISKLESIAQTSIVQNNVVEIMIAIALASVANTVIIPMQDYLGLDSTHRMNTPSTSGENFMWRMAPEALSQELAQKIKRQLQDNNRLKAY